jgi:hypothetical protein
MPFTVSHAALILPFTYLPKRYYSLTGLVAGCMAPDFEYFIRMDTNSEFSHTIAGICWFNLPISILMALIFHQLVKHSLIHNLPKPLFKRFSQFLDFHWVDHFKMNWAMISISVMIGAATHIFWDSFTHHHGYFVRQIPSLNDYIILFGFQFPVFNLLQHVSTLVGGTFLLGAVYLMPTILTMPQTKIKSYWPLVLLIIVVVLVIRVLAGLHYLQWDAIIINIISAGIIALIIAPLALPSKHHSRPLP